MEPDLSDTFSVNGVQFGLILDRTSSSRDGEQRCTLTIEL